MLLAFDMPYWAASLVKAGAVLAIIPAGALIFGYVFLFKMMSHMQSRLGPMEAGPHGVFQLLADGLKFLQKEDIFPSKADRFVFGMAPVVVLLSTFLIYVVIPAGPVFGEGSPYPGVDGPDLYIENLDTGIFFALAASSLSVIGILMAGWASANKYSLMGGLRAAGQLIAYELPLVLAVVGVVIQAGSMSLQTIVVQQSNFEVFGVGIGGMPFIVTQFVGFAIFLVAAQAELTQAPFDMPVAESELVAGYMTEYTGFRFLIFFMGEFGTAFAFSAIGATLFLGGWYQPFFDGNAAALLGPVVLFAKMMLVAFFIFWFRFSFPRLREDQLQSFAWKFLIPISLVNILATAVLKVAF